MPFDPWTASLDDVAAAYSDHVEPTLHNPLFQWAAAQRINELRADVDAGDGSAVLECIHRCISYGLPAPLWLVRAYNERYMRVARYETASWDDAFGRPHPPHTRLTDLQRRHELKFPVALRVRALHAEGSPIGGELFDKVGAEFGISRTVCSELYYAAKAILG